MRLGQISGQEEAQDNEKRCAFRAGFFLFGFAGFISKHPFATHDSERLPVLTRSPNGFSERSKLPNIYGGIMSNFWFRTHYRNQQEYRHPQDQKSKDAKNKNVFIGGLGLLSVYLLNRKTKSGNTPTVRLRGSTNPRAMNSGTRA